MPDERGSPSSDDPRQELQRLAQGLRLRLEGEGRAGLAALGRAKAARSATSPAASAAGSNVAGAKAADADVEEPACESEMEVRAAEAAKRELAERLAAMKSPAASVAGSETAGPETAGSPPGTGEEERAPIVFVKGPQLFDLTSPDTDAGVSREEALARVVAEVAACPQCPELVASRTKTVPGQGSPYAKLMFIGEGPGQDEDRQGLAFVGRAGQLLTKMIESIAMTRDEVFIANILKCRPPQNRQPMPEEAANCRPFLMRQLQIIRPKVIVALGGVAAQNLLETHDGITRLRGRFYPFMGAKLMPTFHPAYVLRNYTPDVRKKVYDDLLKVKAELQA
jgi:DNA polymerase